MMTDDTIIQIHSKGIILGISHSQAFCRGPGKVEIMSETVFIVRLVMAQRLGYCYYELIN